MIILVAAIPTIFLNRALDGWGYPAGLGEIVVLMLLFGYRHFWGYGSFWLRIIAVALIQIPLIRFARPYMYAYKLGFNLLFANLDGLLAIFMIRLGAPYTPDPEATRDR